MNLSQIFSCFQVVFVEVSPAFLADPGTHPYCLGIGIYRNPGTLQLPALRLKGKCPLQLKCICVIDRNLDILSDAVHEILGTCVNLVLIDVDISEVIDLCLIPFERIVIHRDQVPVLIILGQCSGSAYPVIISFTAHTLSAVHLHGSFRLIVILRHHDRHVVLRSLRSLCIR